ncbi:MFS transporter [Bacillus solitudinis]|uniref:MFS transporter n=1 Tax=Bacillus solitudinis TaxID=2014074 RepID=UPI000C2460E1|nr:MFS transporter [Bacillus solitudinis]
MKAKHFVSLTVTQSIIFFASSLIFPFYILFLNNVGSSYSQFGFAYGLFALSSALFHPIIGRWSKKFEGQSFLIAHSWGMALVLLFIPNLVLIEHVYLIQLILGLLGALQKHGEKTVVANLTDGGDRGPKIGNYHFWTSIFSAVAIMIGGFLADFFTIELIFYCSSVLYVGSGWVLLKWRNTDIRKD